MLKGPGLLGILRFMSLANLWSVELSMKKSFLTPGPENGDCLEIKGTIEVSESNQLW